MVAVRPIHLLEPSSMTWSLCRKGDLIFFSLLCMPDITQVRFLHRLAVGATGNGESHVVQCGEGHERHEAGASADPHIPADAPLLQLAGHSQVGRQVAMGTMLLFRMQGPCSSPVQPQAGVPRRQQPSHRSHRTRGQVVLPVTRHNCVII